MRTALMVGVLDAFASGDPNKGNLPYLVMEFIDGESLQDRINRDGAMELREILRIGRQITQRLAAAHEQSLIHRDIEPANLRLRSPACLTPLRRVWQLRAPVVADRH